MEETEEAFALLFVTFPSGLVAGAACAVHIACSSSRATQTTGGVTRRISGLCVIAWVGRVGCESDIKRLKAWRVDVGWRRHQKGKISETTTTPSRTARWHGMAPNHKRKCSPTSTAPSHTFRRSRRAGRLRLMQRSVECRGNDAKGRRVEARGETPRTHGVARVRHSAGPHQLQTPSRSRCK